MNNEHNPIAQLITQIQRTWLEEISPYPKCKLIRFLIDPNETKLYEGFLKLESSPHGKLPDLFIVFLTPFHSIETHSHDILNTWFECYDEDQKTFDQFRITNPGYSWNDKRFREQNEKNELNADSILLEMLSSFYSSLQLPERKLVLTLMPYSINDTKQYQSWLKTIMSKGIPDNIQLCIFL